jgi:hypothetical protein
MDHQDSKSESARIDRSEWERAWRKKLGRLRLGVEPLRDQLAKYRRATIGMTIVPTFLAIFITTLFTAFGRPAIGLIVSAILFLPVVVFAWLEFARLERLVARYESELRERPAEPTAS